MVEDDENIINDLKGKLNNELKIKDLKNFLKIEIIRSRKVINICQRKCVLDLLKDTSVLGGRISTLPVVHNTKLCKDAGELFSSITIYRRLIGRFMHLTRTRLDLGYSVHVLS